MHFLSRRLVMPGDLNYANALFGGRAMEWIDEEAAIFAACQLGSNCLVTKHIGAINFENPGKQGDVIEFGLSTKQVGRTSITITCLMRNKATKRTICFADDIVFVLLDPETQQPIPHNQTIEMLQQQTKEELQTLKIFPAESSE